MSEEEHVSTPAEVLAALKGSIEKWEKIVAGKGIDRGADNCPLCRIFALKHGHCEGCPVAEAVGMHDCTGTPYMEWHNKNPWPQKHPEWRNATTPAHYEAAQKELDFLKSLLPKDAT